MIKKVLKLEKIGKFAAITQDKEFENCNIIFGFNGSGKTTISNTISFFADNSFISEDEKTTIFNNMRNTNDSIVEIMLQNDAKSKYPANKARNYPFYVFNSNFIETHVFDGTKGRLKKFSNIDREIKNAAIEEYDNKIKDLEGKKKKLEVEVQQFEKDIKTITQTHSSNFAKTLTDKNKRLRQLDLSEENLLTKSTGDIQQKLSNLEIDYDLSKKQTELSKDIEQLNSIEFSPCNVDLEKINTALNKNIQQVSKDILEARIKAIQNLFSENPYRQSVEEWFRFGKSILDKSKEKSHTKCPICDSDISDKLDSLLQNFNGYFDKSYEDFITELKGYSDKIQNVIESIRCKEISAGNLGRLYEKYKVILGESQFAQFSFSNLMKELTDIKTAINAKLTNIQSSSAIPKSVTDDLFEMNKILDEYVALKTTIDTTLNAKQLNTNKIEDQLRETYKDMIILEFDKTDKDGALAKYKSSKESIAEISTMDGANDKGLLFYQNKRREELKKIKVESRSISKFLKQMGIEHFTVDINNKAQDENIIIKYNSSETDKNKLRNCLSEGEKTALAFAYFLSKFENERETEDKRRESVVVIDDPISSLDENRLYSTAFLIHNNFKNVKQLIVLSHNFLFLKFFNSLSKGANCLFLNGDKLSALPEELENFESPYFYMLKSVIEFANGAGDYQNAKKYLPNYIRRVLETFSSFKFAKFAKHEELKKFENNIKNMSMLDEKKSDLIEKIAYITKATNQHSHGNAQLTDENFYISEDELKKLAHIAASVIETVDNVHYANCLKDRE